MLTRLKVDGFKNLIGADIQFGPFTCIAGGNGVGKSNLFDAIHFLSALASKPLLEAALSIRDEGGKSTDVRELFHRTGSTYGDKMTFEAEMIVPRSGADALGQTAVPKDTFLRYSIEIGYKEPVGITANGGLEILVEDLRHVEVDDINKYLGFFTTTEWSNSAIATYRSDFYLSTHTNAAGETGIERYYDGRRSAGKPLLTSRLQTTVLSTTNNAEMPELLMARREMQAWSLLQLEPSALRQPDSLTDQPGLGPDGSHLPITLYNLASAGQELEKADQIYSHVANKLHDLLPDVRSISVDRDDQRRVLTLQVTGRDGTSHPARALSDGTLRFLALAIIAADPSQTGIICLEEPENGIHPERIRAMLSLLKDIVTDTSFPVDEDNPLRQIIINTHSPTVVSELQDDDLIIAELQEGIKAGRRYQQVAFKGLPNTWRSRSGIMENASKARLLAYLNPVVPKESLDEYAEELGENVSGMRVIDRPDFKRLSSPILPSQ